MTMTVLTLTLPTIYSSNIVETLLQEEPEPGEGGGRGGLTLQPQQWGGLQVHSEGDSRYTVRATPGTQLGRLQIHCEGELQVQSKGDSIDPGWKCLITMLDLLQEEQHAGGGGREELLHSLHQRVQVHRQRRESAYQNNRQVIIISE